jgi:protein RecA
MARTKQEKSDFETTLSELEKKYGMNRVDPKELTVVSTGSLQLDRAMKIGGTALGKIVELFGENSCGKAQPLSSKILTPNGWINMGDVELGTIVSTPDGGDSTVIGIYPQGEQDVYKITFDDKTFTHCTLDHLWYINGRKDYKGEVLSTKELIETGLKKSQERRLYKIPTTEPVNFNQYGEITIDPYLLGIIIGDGGLTDKNNVKFTCCDDEILQEITKIIEKDYDDIALSNQIGKSGYYFKKKGPKSKWKKNEIFLQLSALGLIGKYSYEKYIPKEYLITSIENRIALLQGLMNSDGTSQQQRSCVSYSSSSILLSKDVEFLCRSLGMRCSTSLKPSKYKNSDGQYVDYLVSYRSNILFNTFSDRYIESIELVGREECQCIMIGHPDQLYITDDFIVTHNTTLTLHQIAEYQKAFPDRRVMLLDYENTFDVKYATAVGVDVDKLLIYQPTTMEQGYDLALSLIKKDIVSCVVIDSQTAAMPQAVLEGEMGDNTIGLQARLNSKFCQKIKGELSLHNTTLFFVSQTRSHIGGYGDGQVSTGGAAIKFYSDVRWKIWKTANKEKEMNITTIDVIKSKVGKPFGQAKVNILWGVGIDKLGEIVDYAVDLGFIQKGGAGWFTVLDSKFQGMDKVKAFLEDNPEYCEELKKQVLHELSDSPVEESIDTITEENEEV